MKMEKLEILEKTFYTAAEYYTKNILLRSTIQKIPFIGNSIDLLFANKASDIFQKRILFFLHSLEVEISELKENTIDWQYINSDKWLDLLLISFDKTIRTRNETKIGYYSKILRGSISDPEIRETAESYLNVLSELSAIEIRVAKLVYEYHDVEIVGRIDSKPPMNDFLDRLEFIDERDLQFYMKRLEKAGLVTEFTGTALGYMGGRYSVTATFDKIFHIVENELANPRYTGRGKCET